MVDENLTKIQLYLAKCLYDCIEDQDLRNIKVLLTEKCANPNIILHDEGGSPLHLVIASGFNECFVYDVVQLFLKHGGDSNLRCGEIGLTPVHVAVASGKSRILYLLLKNNGDIFLKDFSGNTVLEYAKESENCEWITEVAMLMNSLMDGRTICDYLRSINEDFDKSFITVKNDNLGVEEKHTTSSTNYDESYKSLNSVKYDHKKRRKIKEIKKGYFFSPVLDITYTRPSEKITNSDDIQTNDHHKNLLSSQIGELGNLLTSDNGSLITLDESILDFKSCNSEEDEHTSDNTHFNSKREQNLTTIVPELKLTDNLIANNIYSYDLTEELSDNSFKSQNSKNNTICVVDKSYILSPIPYFAMSNSETMQNKNKEITGSTGSMALINHHHIKGEYQTPANYIFYNSKISDKALDDSFESFAIYKCNKKSNALSFESDNYDSDISFKSIDYSKTILAVSEEHKYSDTEQGVHLIERRYFTKPLVLPANESGVSPLLSEDTNEMTFAVDTDYDTDTLRYNLTQLGFKPGPITSTTKKVYLKKLVELWKFPAPRQDEQIKQKVYSAELQKTLQDPEWNSNLKQYAELEKKITDYFECTVKKWRGGNTKSSFTYLLLDPRVTLNLPLRAPSLTPSELWKTFIDSIFYVGKGKRARPYAHLYEAITMWNQQTNTAKSKSGKINHINDIWRDQYGVVCLHIFQNVLPVEAHTREAAMIQVIGLNNLKNVKSGEYYGVAMNWRRKEKCLFGVYLLYKAMQIFLYEGERQLRPADID